MSICAHCARYRACSPRQSADRPRASWPGRRRRRDSSSISASMAVRPTATTAGSSAFLPAHTMTPSGRRMSLGRCVSDGDDVVSTRNTTAASSPFGACTVMTRTSSREISMSPFYFGVGRTQPRHEALQRSRRLAFMVQGKFEELVERIVGFMAEPPQDARPAAIAPERPTQRMQTASRHRNGARIRSNDPAHPEVGGQVGRRARSAIAAANLCAARPA